MGRTLCVWYPDWPLRRPDAPPDRPCQIVDARNRVTAANPLAGGAGVRAGMRRREAEALSPGVVTLAADPGAEAAAFEPVVMAAEELVPSVEVAQPGLMYLPVGGAVRYYGGEAELAERVRAAVEEVAGPARIGLAGGPFAARWAAALANGVPNVIADDEAFLAALDVGTLGHEDLVATFRWLGIGTLGDLARLPRPAIVSRFGTVGSHAHRLASGEDRLLQPRPLPEELWVEERFEEPLADLEQAGFVGRALAGRLAAALQAAGVAAHRVEVEAVAASGVVRTRTWRSADPLGERELADRIRWQLRAWVEGGGVPGGLIRLRVVPFDVSGSGRQLALTEDAASQAEVERALARAQTLVGPDAVLASRPQGGREPGEQVLWYRWGEDVPDPGLDPAAPWPGRVPAPAPALVPSRPRPLEVEWDGGLPVRVRLGSRWEPVLSWAGPWRRTGRWWDGEQGADRYQLVTSAGALLCEVSDGSARLVGIYD